MMAMVVVDTKIKTRIKKQKKQRTNSKSYKLFVGDFSLFLSLLLNDYQRTVMKIYGVSILAGCFLAGHILGDLLGKFFHLSGNLGGVGFAMLFLILMYDYLKKKNLLHEETESGILFWSKMYIPVVVAMSASQNVKAALSGGWVAILVGIIATVACYLLIPVFTSLSQKNN
jgi:malonate transporter MadL subunit